MAVGLFALFKVIRREERNVANLSALLDDPRARLLALRLQNLKRQIHMIDSIIDPPVEAVPTRPLTEREVAMLNKNYLTKIRNKLATATSKLTVALTSIIDTLSDVDPAVEAETNLTENLGKIYRTVIENIGKMFTSLQAMESTVFPDEIITDATELRKTWADLRLTLENQIVEPLRASLMELARENALKKLGETIYSRGKHVG